MEGNRNESNVKSTCLLNFVTTIYGKKAETSEHCRELGYASALSTSIQWTRSSERGETRVISKMALSRAADLLRKAVGKLERVNPEINPGTSREQENREKKVRTTLFKVSC